MEICVNCGKEIWNGANRWHHVGGTAFCYRTGSEMAEPVTLENSHPE